jgi:hypothetical protein
MEVAGRTTGESIIFEALAQERLGKGTAEQLRRAALVSLRKGNGALARYLWLLAIDCELRKMRPSLPELGEDDPTRPMRRAVQA